MSSMTPWFQYHYIADRKFRRIPIPSYLLHTTDDKIPGMDNFQVRPTRICHVVALPFPGRGHVNPMMSLCTVLSSKKPDILVTFVVTEEWLGLIGSNPNKPASVRFATIPNILPSELVRFREYVGFFEAVSTKMEAPVEQLLDRLEPPVNAVIADAHLMWGCGVGNRRRIPVAVLWPQAATLFSMFYHLELLKQNQHFPVELSERGEERVDYIPGVSSTRISDLPTIFFGPDRQLLLPLALECVSMVSKAQYLLIASTYELESRVFESLKSKLGLPVYPIGPIIPYLELKEDSFSSSVSGNSQSVPNCREWLDCQPKNSVLYVSMGSFLSVSSAQTEEIFAGVHDSGVKYLWVSRGQTTWIKDGFGDRGLVVPWCNQLSVICHPAIGGFWTHCGWNSTQEVLFAGVPVLACPIFWDQVPNSKLIVEDWKMGWRVKRGVGENLVTSQEIAKLVRNFMDPENREVNEMRKRGKELQELWRAAIGRGGSSDRNLDSFIRDISQGHA